MGRLVDAAESGSRLAALKELRDMIAQWLEQSNSDRDRAALSRQFMQVTAEIYELENAEAPKKTSIADMRDKLRAVK